MKILLRVKNFISHGIMPLKESFLFKWVDRKTSRFSSSVKIILTIIILVTLWMLSGIFKSGDHQLNKQKLPVVKVKALHSIAQERQTTITLNGYTKSSQNIDIKPEVDGLITEIIVKNGQFLKKDDPIVRIETSNKRYALKKAEADLAKQQFNYEAAKKIYEKRLSSEGALKDALVNLKNAESSFNEARLNLEKTIITAPFDGYIDEILVHDGDFISVLQNSVIAKFTSTRELFVVAFIPQTQIASITESAKVRVIGNNSRVLDGKITFISKIANPNTRAFQIEALVNNEDGILHIGESVKLQIFLSLIKRLHKVPKSALILDTDGRISVKIVGESSRVTTVPVEIIDEDDNAFWVEGLIDEADIVILGGSYVKDGETVNVGY